MPWAVITVFRNVSAVNLCIYINAAHGKSFLSRRIAVSMDKRGWPRFGNHQRRPRVIEWMESVYIKCGKYSRGLFYIIRWYMIFRYMLLMNLLRRSDLWKLININNHKANIIAAATSVIHVSAIIKNVRTYWYYY